MSGRHRSFEQGTVITRNKGKIAFVASLAVAAAFAPKAWELLDESHRSKIVAGVPAQVEGHGSGSHCASSVKAVCNRWVRDYYLWLEQCPADIEAAKRGEETQSFNPAVGAYYEGCTYDAALVDVNTWQSYAPGSVIVFDGAVGGRLDK